MSSTAVRSRTDRTCSIPFQGISGGLLEGMITGHVVSGTSFAGRLTRGSNAQLGLRRGGSTHFVDNVPLWEYIGYEKGVTVPFGCTRESFDLTVSSSGYAATEAQMAACLTTYAAGSGFADLFDIDADNNGVYDIVGSPRFGVVPQFFELTFPEGASAALHLAGFRAVFINGLYFGCTGQSCSTVITPGSVTGTVSIPNGSSPLDQITGYLLPSEAVPDVLLANGVNGSLGPYQVRLSS